MSESALNLSKPDLDTLLGYENALGGHSRGSMVFVASDEDIFNALDKQGIPCIFPRDGEWHKNHAELVIGWELVFAFTAREYRLKVGRIVDGYAAQTFILTDEKTGHSDIISYLEDNELDLDGLLTLADRAAVYEYREEEAIQAAIIPLIGMPIPQANYPSDTLGPIIGNVVNSIIANVQVSIPLAAQSALAVASLAAQSFANVKPPYFAPKPLPCSNFFLTIAESGERKSAANNTALVPVTKWEQHTAQRYEYEASEYRTEKSLYDKLVAKAEGRSKTIEQGKNAIEAIGVEPRAPLSSSIVVTETTIEGFLKSAENTQGGRAIITDEAGVFLGGHSMSSEKRLLTLTILAKLWDASDIVMTRVGRGTPPIRGKRLTVNLMGQSVVVNPLLSDPLAQGQGFLARFLIVHAPPRAGSREVRTSSNEADYKALNAWTDHIYEILSQRSQMMHADTLNELNPPVLELNEDAIAVWKEFAQEVEKAQRPEGKYEDIKPFASKAAEHVLRIAGIFPLLNSQRAQAS